ncbi:MAG: ATP-binding cassette domain-containing protein [Nitrososphaerota archaeon]|nr:ATP-binding cassette domain-containing protein [Aigarchaeota archaeon]MDW8076350.1 ATP-binding cassette domain-containing protein [Nitrososphaerota archaeon]
MVLLKVSCPFKESLKTFKINKTFRTVTKVTKRTIAVSDAFGIGVDEEKVFPIFKDFLLEINPGDVVYITGESGSGKSVLLRELVNQLGNYGEFRPIVTDKDVEIDPDEIVIHGVGKDTSEAIEILSFVGLAEAFIFLRRYKELSDGQKYRYRLAKAIWKGAKTLVFDEFCATLDRTTAKVVAYLSQKFCRKRGITLIVATTHTDLLEDLNPNVYVVKKFGVDVDVTYFKPEPRPCSLMKDVVISRCTVDDYKRLAIFHYKGARASFITDIFKAEVGSELAGVIVYVTPHFNLKPRNLALPHLLEIQKREGLKALTKYVNRNFKRIARVVVAPKYRGIGLGVRLVKETMPLVGVPYVETLAVMARYNPFFEHAGMKEIEYEREFDKKQQKVLEFLEGMGLNVELSKSKRRNLSWLEMLNRKQIENVARIIGSFASERFSRPGLIKRIKSGDFSLEDLAEAITLFKAKPKYYIWKNPSFTEFPEPLVQEVLST